MAYTNGAPEAQNPAKSPKAGQTAQVNASRGGKPPSPPKGNCYYGGK